MNKTTLLVSEWWKIELFFNTFNPLVVTQIFFIKEFDDLLGFFFHLLDDFGFSVFEFFIKFFINERTDGLKIILGKCHTRVISQGDGQGSILIHTRVVGFFKA